jgi:VWFA-related protein
MGRRIFERDHLRLLILCCASAIIAPLPRLAAQKPQVAASEYTVRSEVDLLSVAVRVTDRKDNEIHGLTANQFALYEDGQPQKITFFEAGSEPVSLGILLDVSGSMGATRELDQAKDALSHVISTMRPKDEMLYLRFHLEVEKVLDFTSDAHRVLSAISATTATKNGTSLYDAVARALCYMRSAHHHRQALLVVTDGADQNSHRSLDELIPIVQASQAQVFVICSLGKAEYEAYRSSRKQKIPLVTRQEIDNPLTTFNQLAKESGAESFFPDSPDKLQEAVDAVAHELRTQYTLAYYPMSKAAGFHRIEVKVAQSGARVRARHGFTMLEPSAGREPLAQSGGCENEKLKPYPYESKVTTKNGCTLYHEDFQNPASGWPGKDDYHYKSGTYQIVNGRHSQPNYDMALGGGMNLQVAGADHGSAVPLEGLLVANGPLLTGDLNASVSVEWKSSGGKGSQPAIPGLVFRLHDQGYYAVLVASGVFTSRDLAFKLVKKYHIEPAARDLLPWTEHPLSDRSRSPREVKISVQCRGARITILIQDTPVAKFEDDEFNDGLVGMILYGAGTANFRDLLAEEVCNAGLAPPLSNSTCRQKTEDPTERGSAMSRGDTFDWAAHSVVFAQPGPGLPGDGRQIPSKLGRLWWLAQPGRAGLRVLPHARASREMLGLSKVRAYLAGGGKLILSHESGLDAAGKQFALTEMGLEYVEPSPNQGNKGDYIEVLEGANQGIAPMAHFTYVPGSVVKALPGATTLARIWKPYFDRNYQHFSSHQQTAYDQPAEA